MTKEKKTTSTKKTSKAKLVKVEEKPFDLIIDLAQLMRMRLEKKSNWLKKLHIEKRKKLIQNLWILNQLKHLGIRD